MIIYGDAALDDRRMAELTEQLAAAVAVEPGERVVIVAPNCPALVAGLLAAWRLGGVAVPLSARLRAFELERALADVRPAAAICVGGAGFDPVPVVAASGVRRVVVTDELGSIVGRQDVGTGHSVERSSEELAAILYTSGTTGEPKGALLLHAGLKAFADNASTLLGFNADAAHGLVAPASHAFGLATLLAAMSVGATVVLIDASASVKPMLDALRAHGVGSLHGTPALFGRLLRSGAEVPIKSGLVAGSSCPPSLLEALDERGVRLLNLYGMSEIGAASSCRPDDPPATRYTTCGRALPGYELRSVDGEIQVRSPYIADGYHGRSWTEDEITADGWLRTGDLGRVDDDGRVVIEGRAKEVVHVGGFNVFPAEVEAYLLTHPSIEQAAAVGTEHPVLGEALEAFVVPAAGATLTPTDVIRFARAGIAGYKVPYTVHIRGELPLLPSGKPDRRALAEVSSG